MQEQMENVYETALVSGRVGEECIEAFAMAGSDGASAISTLEALLSTVQMTNTNPPPTPPPSPDPDPLAEGETQNESEDKPIEEDPSGPSYEGGEEPEDQSGSN